MDTSINETIAVPSSNKWYRFFNEIANPYLYIAILVFILFNFCIQICCKLIHIAVYQFRSLHSGCGTLFAIDY